ncbi:MAG: hypothetical protein HQP61_05775 [Peptococcaceae bacterium]|nr:hypothetical protein [Candidatus Syntrophopropionicum ammoniitolerans]
MGLKMRCMLCGRPIDDEILASADPFEDEDEDDDDIPKKKPMSVCLRCQAKLKHEADNQQKIPKPM